MRPGGARARLLGVRLVVLLSVVATLLAACGGDKGALVNKAQTFAELRAIKRGVTVTEPGGSSREPFTVERLIDGQQIDLVDGALATLRRDAGVTLLVAGPARLVLHTDAIELMRGRVFVDTPPGVTGTLSTPRGALMLSAVRASVEVDEAGALTAYVLDGAVRLGATASAGPGEQLTVDPAGKASSSAVVAWEDWTGGLATTDRAPRPAPFGVGTVGARPPGAKGEPRVPLSIERLDVRVTIDGDLATTEVEQIFSNPTSATVEGLYSFRTPLGATLHHFGVDRDGRIVWGRVKEREAAVAQYQSHVYAGSREDPALLVWDAPGVYKARLYPIGAREKRRIVTRYAEWLPREGERSERRLYVYPMAADGAEGTLPRIDEMRITLDLAAAAADEVRVGMQGKREGATVTVTAYDFSPRADFAVELYDAGRSGSVAYQAVHAVDRLTTPKDALKEAHERARSEAPYVLVPLRPGAPAAAKGGLDVSVVIDTSAATDPGSLVIARAAAGALLAHLGPEDRVALFAGDATLRPVTEGTGTLAALDRAGRERLALALAQLERGGATDLGAIVTEAAGVLGTERRGAVVYIGDGRPTVGENDRVKLRERLQRLPPSARVFAIGVGDSADMARLAGMARGGLAMRVGDRAQAARAALDVLASAERAVWLGAEVDLGTGIDRVYPRTLGALGVGETAFVVGRVVGALPDSVTLSSAAGSVKLPLVTRSVKDDGDLRRRWAMGRLGQLLEEDAGRAAVVEIGVRSGIITPFTSLYVPTRAEAAREGAAPDAERADGTPWWKWLFEGDDYDDAVAAESVAYESDLEDSKEGGTGTRAKGEEGQMGRSPSRASNKRYAVKGPSDNPEPRPAPMAAAPVDKNVRLPDGLESAKEEEQAERIAMAPMEAPAPQQDRAPGAPADEPAAMDPMMDRRAADEAGIDDPLAGLGMGGGGRGEGIGLGNVGTLGHGAGTGAGQGFGSGHGRLGGGASSKSRRQKRRGDDEAPPSSRPVRSPSPHPGVTGVGQPKLALDLDVTTETESDVSLGRIGHARVPCAPAADLPVEERAVLWRERFAGAGGAVSRVVQIYHHALRSCEAPTWRERTLLLVLGTNVLVTVQARVDLWRAFLHTKPAADVIYRALLTRLRSADDLRALHEALGLKSVDQALLDRTLAKADGADARARVLAGLWLQFPDDLTLALRLLDAYEDAADEAGGRALARTLRRRSDANTRIRTHVGEYYLRLAERGSGPAHERDRVEARRTFGEIVEFAPEDPLARRLLGDLLRAHGWFEEAARQYETLARLVPDDTTVPLLIAATAQGLGRTEEAVRLTEKAAESGSPDPSSAFARTARALASVFLAESREAARTAGKQDEAERLLMRARRLTALDAADDASVRVVLTWSHPELEPELWGGPESAPMPALDGDPALGVAQLMLAGATQRVEVRLGREEAERAHRLGAVARLTVIGGEGSAGEHVQRLTLKFGAPKAGAALTIGFDLEGRQLSGDTP